MLDIETAHKLASFLEAKLSLKNTTEIPRPVHGPLQHEHCLKAHSVEQALSSCACRMTFTTSDRGPVENCKSLVEVNLMSTEITALLSSTFAHCVACSAYGFHRASYKLEKKPFLNCVVLQELVIPTEPVTSATVPSASASSCTVYPPRLGRR